MDKSKKRKFSATLSVITCCVIIVILELGLRIIKPFDFRLKGNNIVLKKNFTTVIDNKKGLGLDERIIVRKNSLGFRGDELPQNLDEYVSILTIGGNTTEGLEISDGKTWSDHLKVKLSAQMPNVWLNNAGLSGHSTFGHLFLLKDHIVNLKPDYLIFLVGVNDLLNNDIVKQEKYSLKNKKTTNIKDFVYRSMDFSEILNTTVNISRITGQETLICLILIRSWN